MHKKTLFLLVAFLLSLPVTFAARVDTLWIRSASMQRDVQVVAVIPDVSGGKKAVACPVVYLLHGYSGNAKSWIAIKPDLPKIADEKGIIFVCPDGKNSWYWDSPKNPSYRYETFVSSELVEYIDTHYATIPHRKARAITGLSMGGYGTWSLACDYPERFAAIAPICGGGEPLFGPRLRNVPVWAFHLSLIHI